MKCPNCPTTDLVMADRAGVEIDYCPSCRGVWLDRGELDKIIERSAAATAPSAPARKYDDTPPSGTYRKKKSSFLGEIFDF